MNLFLALDLDLDLDLRILVRTFVGGCLSDAWEFGCASSILLTTVSLVCSVEISRFSHRFRSVLRTLGAINQVSTEAQASDGCRVHGTVMIRSLFLRSDRDTLLRLPASA